MIKFILSLIVFTNIAFASVWNIQNENDFINSIDNIVENKDKDKEHVLFMTNNIKIFDDNNQILNKIKLLNNITIRIFDSNGQILNQDGTTTWLIENVLKKTPNNFTPGFGFDLTLQKEEAISQQPIQSKESIAPKQKIILSDEDDENVINTNKTPQQPIDAQNYVQQQKVVNNNVNEVDKMIQKQKDTNDLIYNSNNLPTEQPIVKQPTKTGRSDLFKMAINELKANNTDNIVNVTKETELSYNKVKETNSKMQEPTTEQLNTQSQSSSQSINDKSIVKQLPNNGVLKKGVDDKQDEFTPVLSSKEKQVINYREDEDKSLKTSDKVELKKENKNNNLTYDKFVTFQKDPNKRISKVNEDSLIAKFMIAMDSYKKVDVLIDMRDNIPMISAKNLAQLESFYNDSYSTSDKELKLSLLNSLCQYTQGTNQFYEYKKSLGKLLMSYTFSQNHPEVILAKKTLSILEND